jgi:hypothetical protein
VLVAVTPGAFSFDRWPDAPQSALSEREVVVDVPVAAPTARADARPKPAVEADGSTVVAQAPERRSLDRPDAPTTVAVPPRFVTETDSVPEPGADGEGATVPPAHVEAAPETPSRAPLPAPEVPALPELPAKQLPEDEPDEEPDQRLPELAGDRATLPRRLRDDQE